MGRTRISRFVAGVAFLAFVIVTTNSNLELGCKFAMPDPWDPSIMPLINHPRSYECQNKQKFPDLVQLDDFGWLWLRSEKTSGIQGSINCIARMMDRGKNDDDIIYSEPQTLTAAKPLAMTKTVAEVNCVTESDSKLFYNLFVFPENLTKSSFVTDEDHLSIVIFAIDSMSYSRVRRSLPSTYSYLRQKMGSFVFRGHHRTGYNTYPNILPVLTGKRVRSSGPDMPTELSDEGGKNNYSTWPLIWWEAEKLGYISSYNEDWPGLGVFNQLADGFGKKPVDHFYRPFFLGIEKDSFKSSSGCFRNLPIPYRQIDLFQAQMKKYWRTKQFSFNFISKISHDSINDVEKIDLKFASTIQLLHEGGYFNNTVLIFMGDHGQRYNKIRFTAIGSIEENMPFLSISLPSWFTDKHTNLKHNLEMNQMRLSSHFDTHETMQDLINSNFYAQQRNESSRSHSLLYEIPKHRSCLMAGIPAVFCTCNQDIEPVDPNSDLMMKGAKQMVAVLNKRLKPYKSKCATLYFKRIVRAERLNSDKTGPNQQYRIAVEVKPSAALFEPIFTHVNKTGEILLENQILRINKYGDQSSGSQHNQDRYPRKYTILIN